MLWEYWQTVNEEDLSEWEDVEISPGITAPYQKTELMVYTLAKKGSQFWGAYLGDELIGFNCCRIALKTLLVIEHFFVLPEYEGMGIAKGMVHSMPYPIKKIFFWTRKKNPPKLLEVMKYATPLNEDDRHITWEMTWAARPT